jgi:hypothetical protein
MNTIKTFKEITQTGLNNLLFVTCCFVFLITLSPQAAKCQQLVFNGEKSTWHEGFDRYDFIMDDATLEITPFKKPDKEKFNIGDPPPGKHRCILIAPKSPAAGNPWSWRGCYWDHQP